VTNLDVAFRYLVAVDEGSKYTNNPNDSGGPTKFGITKRTYQNYFQKLVLESEIENMTPDIAKQIYEKLYWKPMCCDRVEDLVFATVFFNCGVLYGIGTAALLVQRSLSLNGGTLKLDGHLGDKSVGLINTMVSGPLTRISLMTSFHGLLLEHIDQVIVANPKNEVFRRGWTLRANRLASLLIDGALDKYKTEDTS
jgi:lysozyme family protein